MNVYDVAHQLARAIAESEEYRDFLAQIKKLEASDSATDMYADFRHRELELQAEQMMGQTPAEGKVNQLRKLAEIISMHPDVAALTSAEYRFERMMADLQRIQSEALSDWLEFTERIAARAIARTSEEGSGGEPKAGEG